MPILFIGYETFQLLTIGSYEVRKIRDVVWDSLLHSISIRPRHALVVMAVVYPQLFLVSQKKENITDFTDLLLSHLWNPSDFKQNAFCSRHFQADMVKSIINTECDHPHQVFSSSTGHSEWERSSKINIQFYLKAKIKRLIVPVGKGWKGLKGKCIIQGQNFSFRNPKINWHYQWSVTKQHCYNYGRDVFILFCRKVYWS